MAIFIRTRASYEQALPLQLPPWVSGDHVKRYRFVQEAYFQEAYYSIPGLVDGQQSLREWTFLLLKPDCFPSGASSRVIPAAAQAGFTAVAAVPVKLDRLMIRELWRYELNIAAMDRYLLLDEFLECGPSVLLLLRGAPGLDASQALASIKGNSMLPARNASCLRARIDARGGMLNHIHSPDTFIDLVRELGILLGRRGIQSLFESLQTADLPSPASVLAHVQASYPAHSLRLEQVLQGVAPEFARALTAGADAHGRWPFSAVSALCHEFGLPCWDRVTVLNDCLEVSVPGVVRSLDFETAVETAVDQPHAA
jgi:nucleoside diphosphate kinase